LSDNGKGNAEDIIEFDTLDLDEDKSGPNKIKELQSFLKESLEPEKYSDAMKILGISDDMSNTQLLEKITLLVKKPEEEEEEEEEDKEKKAAKPEEEEEEKTASPNYKDFMDKCMKAGKSMADCAKEFKEKHPAPKKEEESEVEQLAESEWKEEIDLARKKKKDEYEYPEKKESELSAEVRKELDELKLELSRIKEEKRLMEITHKVDEQIQEKHLAPKQRDHVIKLMAKLDDSHHDELLGTFATQKFKGFEDVGKTDIRRPGAPEELDEETRMKLMKEHGIADLIQERGMKRRAS